MAVVQSYVARSPAEFEAIADWVNDSRSATAQLIFDAHLGELRVQLENAPPAGEVDDFAKPELLKETLFGRYYRQPYFRCALTVRNAVGTEPSLTALEEPISFSYPQVAEDGRSIYFEGHTDCAFRVLVTALDVELRVTDEIAYYREHGYARGAIAWESRGDILK